MYINHRVTHEVSSKPYNKSIDVLPCNLGLRLPWVFRPYNIFVLFDIWASSDPLASSGLMGQTGHRTGPTLLKGYCTGPGSTVWHDWSDTTRNKKSSGMCSAGPSRAKLNRASVGWPIWPPISTTSQAPVEGSIRIHLHPSLFQWPPSLHLVWLPALATPSITVLSPHALPPPWGSVFSDHVHDHYGLSTKTNHHR